jgi:hypothetical protein
MNPLLLNAVVAADSAAGYMAPSDSFAMRMFREEGVRRVQEREARRHKKGASLGSSHGFFSSRGSRK